MRIFVIVWSYNSLVLKLVVHVFKHVFFMFLYSLNNMTNLRHLSYQWEDNTSIIRFFVFPKRVILKRENNALPMTPKASVYVHKFHLTLNLKTKVWRGIFQKNENVNSYLHFLLKCRFNVTCLVVCVISIYDVWFFSLTSHTTCQIMNCVRVN